MSEFELRRRGRSPDAEIRSMGEEVGELKRGEGHVFRLLSRKAGGWELSPRVQGEIRPFSMSVKAIGEAGGDVLTIRNHLFFRKGRAYLIAGIPEEGKPSDHLFGRVHINRLDTFPFASLEEVDLETWGRLRRHRGVSVGTIEGLGETGFRVSLAPELDEVGLPLAAASYLLYSS